MDKIKQLDGMPTNEVNSKEKLRQLNYLEQLHQLRMERQAYEPEGSLASRVTTAFNPSSINGEFDTRFSGSIPNPPTSDEIPLTKRSTSTKKVNDQDDFTRIQEEIRALNHREQLSLQSLPSSDKTPTTSDSWLAPNTPSSDEISFTRCPGSIPSPPIFDPLPLSVDEEPTKNRSVSIPSLPPFDPLPPSIDEIPAKRRSASIDETPTKSRSASIPSLPPFDPLPLSIDEEPIQNPLSEFLVRQSIEAFMEERTAARRNNRAE
jgi:hypothetical protein